MTPPDRAIVIDHADPDGFSVTLDPPGPGSTIDAVVATLPKAKEYAHGVALALRCSVIDLTELAAFDGAAEIIRELQALLPTIEDISAMGPPLSVGPSVPVPAVFVHVLIDEVQRLRGSVASLESALLMATPRGAA